MPSEYTLWASSGQVKDMRGLVRQFDTILYVSKTPIASAVVEKLIGRLTTLIGHCFTFCRIAPLSDVLAIKFEGLRNPETYAVPAVYVNLRKNEY